MTNKAPEAKVAPDGKLQADFFTTVRERGLINAMMQRPAYQYMADNPDDATRWEFSPTNGDQSLVQAREAMGWRVVDASELPQTASSQKSGPVRVGDAILMAGPKELDEMTRAADAQLAEDDVRMPERAFYDNLENTKVRRKDGAVDQAKPTGGTRITHEFVTARPELSGG